MTILIRFWYWCLCRVHMRILVRILVEVSPNSIAVKLVLNVSILFQACSSVEGFERIFTLWWGGQWHRNNWTLIFLSELGASLNLEQPPVCYIFQLAEKLSLWLWFPVFGVPLYALVERQNSSRPVPQIVIRCVEYLVKSGTYSIIRLEPCNLLLSAAILHLLLGQLVTTIPIFISQTLWNRMPVFSEC